MRLYFYGHDYKYAAEQMLLTLFPQERPEYPQGDPQGDRLELSLKEGEKRCTVSCRLCLGEGSWRSMVWAAIPRDAKALDLERLRQGLIKRAIYQAALKSGVPRPAWGMLTGVRPGKLMEAQLSQGISEAQALRHFTRDLDVSPQRAALCLDTSRETMKVQALLSPRDVCLYVGIPFCPTRCAYCSFVSQSVEKSMALIEPFLEALLREIEATARQVRELGLRVSALYMGGGTPTTLSASLLDRLCSCLEENFDLSHLREYTVEAGRPDTITLEKLRTLRRHGADRISVNPQTMDDRVLEAIGRKHSAQDIVHAMELAAQAGGLAVNMDLIAGLPGDSLEGFTGSLEKVIALGPENVTVHTLSLKKGSRLTLEGQALEEGRKVAAMLDEASRLLRGAGYGPYYLYRQKFITGGFENTGWAKPGYVGFYNVCMMEELCSILAMGGGGSTKLISPGQGRNIRMADPKYPLEYIENIDKILEDKLEIGEFYRRNWPGI